MYGFIMYNEMNWYTLEANETKQKPNKSCVTSVSFRLSEQNSYQDSEMFAIAFDIYKITKQC